MPKPPLCESEEALEVCQDAKEAWTAKASCCGPNPVLRGLWSSLRIPSRESFCLPRMEGALVCEHFKPTVHRAEPQALDLGIGRRTPSSDATAVACWEALKPSGPQAAASFGGVDFGMRHLLEHLEVQRYLVRVRS